VTLQRHMRFQALLQLGMLCMILIYPILNFMTIVSNQTLYGPSCSISQSTNSM